jgi:hypothetical protein
MNEDQQQQQQLAFVIERFRQLFSERESERREADAWLQQLATHSEQAWALYLALLHEADVSVAHFGAHALVQLIKQRYDGLGTEQQDALLRSLIDAFDHFAMRLPATPTTMHPTHDGASDPSHQAVQLMLTRVSVALAQVVRLSFPQRWHVLATLLQLPQTFPTRQMARQQGAIELTESYVCAVLRLLELVPQEMDLTTETRNQLLLSLATPDQAAFASASSFDHVLLTLFALLEQGLDAPQAAVKAAALQCATSWCFSLHFMASTNLMQKILTSVFQYATLFFLLSFSFFSFSFFFLLLSFFLFSPFLFLFLQFPVALSDA